MINEASATASPAVLYTFPCGPEFPAPACLLALGPLALPASSSWCWTGGTGAGGLEWGVGREKGLALDVGAAGLTPTPGAGWKERNNLDPLWPYLPHQLVPNHSANSS